MVVNRITTMGGRAGGGARSGGGGSIRGAFGQSLGEYGQYTLKNGGTIRIGISKYGGEGFSDKDIATMTSAGASWSAGKGWEVTAKGVKGLNSASKKLGGNFYANGWYMVEKPKG